MEGAMRDLNSRPPAYKERHLIIDKRPIK